MSLKKVANMACRLSKDKILIQIKELLSYLKTKPADLGNKNKTIHFFTYDWNFENVYQKPEQALEKLDQYYALLTPEFSTYKDMPLARQIDSVFKNRWCGAFWQKQGMLVIPTISWALMVVLISFAMALKRAQLWLYQHIQEKIIKKVSWKAIKS